MTTVAVLGGGVAGLSAAHELAERGFEVTVYEHRDVFGGKARSMPVPGSGTGGRADLPAEHGFRFFPGFYRHLPDTMNRIPYGNRTVFHHLVNTTRMMIAQTNGDNEIIGPTATPESFNDLEVALKFGWTIDTQLGIPEHELAEFYERLLMYLASCEERRLKEWEYTGWWEFVEAEGKSKAYQDFLAIGMTRTLVAAQAKEMSARTGASILWQLIFDMTRLGGHADRVLDGPTSEVWIDPWIEYLQSRDVMLCSGCEVEKIDCDGRRVTGVTVRTATGSQPVNANYYIAALPVERLKRLLTPELLAVEPRLIPVSKVQDESKDSESGALTVRWMNGIMFYLHRDVPVVNGHILFVDSPWALTAISQKQFWHAVDLSERGDGDVHGILSVDVSDWESPGRNGKSARECTRQEIHDEVWKQIVAAIDDDSLQQQNVVDWFLDEDIQFPNPNKVVNAEPLLVNTAGSWANRPDAVTRIPNFFLASDYVRTNTDLATMEAANEAARRAVNGVLKATGSRARPCKVWKLHEPLIMSPFRMADRLRWRFDRPVKVPIRMTPDGKLQATGTRARGLLAATRRSQAALNSFGARRR